VRENPYFRRDSRVGHLDKALDAARRQVWTVVSMKNDWRVFLQDTSIAE
jgi:hypothetical protein